MNDLNMLIALSGMLFLSVASPVLVQRMAVLDSVAGALLKTVGGCFLIER